MANGNQTLIKRTPARARELFPIDMAVADYDRTSAMG
jgi:hypothetical protein